MSEKQLPAVLQRRQLAANVLVFTLGTEDSVLQERAASAHEGRAAKTLVEQGSLRITLIAMTRDTVLQPHQAAGPISIQTVRGTLRVTTDDGDIDLAPGDLATLGPGIRHTAQALEDCAFLLTISMP
jgi:quercetin dioxygenase-like cupin family protein